MDAPKSVLLLILLLIAGINSQYPDYIDYYGFPYGAQIPQGQLIGIAGVDPITGAITGAITGGLMGIFHHVIISAVLGNAFTLTAKDIHIVSILQTPIYMSLTDLMEKSSHSYDYMIMKYAVTVH
ncbi:unnamed protein product [Cylicocyclus nassatus]|uniref:Uncharacterized protein n=1 Tax=Cylicocyclus nassatus TaxID=53992 RepID=A0AA36GGM6_CYLNA|nr:unnamed protein product [Cylicocyclus nassatus]